MIGKHKKDVVPSDISLNRCVDTVNRCSKRIGQICFAANTPYHVSVSNEAGRHSLNTSGVDVDASSNMHTPTRSRSGNSLSVRQGGASGAKSPYSLTRREQARIMNIEMSKHMIEPIMSYIALRQEEQERRDQGATMEETQAHVDDPTYDLYYALGCMHRWLIEDDGAPDTNEQQHLQHIDDAQEAPHGAPGPDGQLSATQRKAGEESIIKMLVDERDVPKYSYPTLVDLIGRVGLLPKEYFPYDCYSVEARRDFFRQSDDGRPTGGPPPGVDAGIEHCNALMEVLRPPEVDPDTIHHVFDVVEDPYASPSSEGGQESSPTEGSYKSVYDAIPKGVVRRNQVHVSGLLQVWARALTTYFLHCELLMQIEAGRREEKSQREQQAEAERRRREKEDADRKNALEAQISQRADIEVDENYDRKLISEDNDRVWLNILDAEEDERNGHHTAYENAERLRLQQQAAAEEEARRRQAEEEEAERLRLEEEARLRNQRQQALMARLSRLEDEEDADREEYEIEEMKKRKKLLARISDELDDLDAMEAEGRRKLTIQLLQRQKEEEEEEERRRRQQQLDDNWAREDENAEVERNKRRKAHRERLNEQEQLEADEAKRIQERLEEQRRAKAALLRKEHLELVLEEIVSKEEPLHRRVVEVDEEAAERRHLNNIFTIQRRDIAERETAQRVERDRLRRLQEQKDNDRRLQDEQRQRELDAEAAEAEEELARQRLRSKRRQQQEDEDRIRAEELAKLFEKERAAVEYGATAAGLPQYKEVGEYPSRNTLILEEVEGRRQIRLRFTDEFADVAAAQEERYKREEEEAREMASRRKKAIMKARDDEEREIRARRQAEEEAKQKREAEAEARRQAEEEARQKREAEEEARRRRDELFRQEQVEIARRKAAEQRRRELEDEIARRLKDEEDARRRAEEEAAERRRREEEDWAVEEENQRRAKASRPVKAAVPQYGDDLATRLQMLERENRFLCRVVDGINHNQTALHTHVLETDESYQGQISAIMSSSNNPRNMIADTPNKEQLLLQAGPSSTTITPRPAASAISASVPVPMTTSTDHSDPPDLFSIPRATRDEEPVVEVEEEDVVVDEPIELDDAPEDRVWAGTQPPTPREEPLGVPSASRTKFINPVSALRKKLEDLTRNEEDELKKQSHSSSNNDMATLDEDGVRVYSGIADRIRRQVQEGSAYQASIPPTAPKAAPPPRQQDAIREDPSLSSLIHKRAMARRAAQEAALSSGNAPTTTTTTTAAMKALSSEDIQSKYSTPSPLSPIQAQQPPQQQPPAARELLCVDEDSDDDDVIDLTNSAAASPLITKQAPRTAPIYTTAAATQHQQYSPDRKLGYGPMSTPTKSQPRPTSARAMKYYDTILGDHQEGPPVPVVVSGRMKSAAAPQRSSYGLNADSSTLRNASAAAGSPTRPYQADQARKEAEQKRKLATLAKKHPAAFGKHHPNGLGGWNMFDDEMRQRGVGVYGPPGADPSVMPWMNPRELERNREDHLKQIQEEITDADNDYNSNITNRGNKKLVAGAMNTATTDELEEAQERQEYEINVVQQLIRELRHRSGLIRGSATNEGNKYVSGAQHPAEEDDDMLLIPTPCIKLDFSLMAPWITDQHFKLVLHALLDAVATLPPRTGIRNQRSMTSLGPRSTEFAHPGDYSRVSTFPHPSERQTPEDQESNVAATLRIIDITRCRYIKSSVVVEMLAELVNRCPMLCHVMYDHRNFPVRHVFDGEKPRAFNTDDDSATGYGNADFGSPDRVSPYSRRSHSPRSGATTYDDAHPYTSTLTSPTKAAPNSLEVALTNKINELKDINKPLVHSSGVSRAAATRNVNFSNDTSSSVAAASPSSAMKKRPMSAGLGGRKKLSGLAM